MMEQPAAVVGGSRKSLRHMPRSTSAESAEINQCVRGGRRKRVEHDTDSKTYALIQGDSHYSMRGQTLTSVVSPRRLCADLVSVIDRKQQFVLWGRPEGLRCNAAILNPTGMNLPIQ